jgi:hypothetical protein
MTLLPRYRKEHPVFTTTEAAVAGDRVQQLRAEARRDGQARVLRAARRSARRAAR